MLVKLNEIQNFTLRARDGGIGKTQDYYFDDEYWVLRYFVVGTGAWLLDRHSVLLSPSAFGRMDKVRKIIYLNLTQEQVRHSPAADTAKPIPRQYEEQLSRHYQWSAYWATPLDGVFDRGDRVYPETPGSHIVYPETRPRPEEQYRCSPEDTHLRNTAALKKYKLHATDGELGEVEDFIADDANWKIRYLEIRTGRWRSSHHIVLAVQWITDISWANRSVDFDLSEQAIQTAPAYDPSQPITAEYEQQLAKHYAVFVKS